MKVTSVGTFPVILVKLATPPLTIKQSWIFSKMGGNESFFGHNIARGSGDEKMKPKPIQELSLGAESSVTVTWNGFFT